MQANKALVQVIGAMASAALPLLVGGEVGASQWINVAIAMSGAGTVYIAANLEDGGIWSYTKAIMSGISAALVLLVSQLTDGIQSSEWAQIIATLIATVAVALVRNDSDTVGRHRAETT